MKLKALAAGLLALSLAACSSPKGSLSYFENIPDGAGTLASADFSIKIQPGDELYITVSSVVPTATMQYNLPASNPALAVNNGMSTTPREQTYIVDKEGDIKFPILGEIKVEGMTTEQLADLLTRRISEDVEDPLVRVQLANFKVNVLGEVLTPGPQQSSTERYSLLDAIAAAGDLTPYGCRDNVLLIREEGGQKVYKHFNLNDAATLSSPYFYLQQNDVVYVYPNEIRKSNARYNQYNSYKIQVVSAVVSATSVVASLVIALAIK